MNNLGTATLLQILTEKPVSRLIVASSMSVYGEGLYRAADGSIRAAVDRSIEQLRAGDWEIRDETGETLTPRAYSGNQNSLPFFGLCAFQIRSGAALPDGGPCVWDARRGAALSSMFMGRIRPFRTLIPAY